MAKQAPVIWQRLQTAAQRQLRALDHEGIARAAIQIADAEGLRAVTMRKVASRLDRGTMSLYRYVNGKDDLVELMYDTALAEVVPDHDPGGDWRADLAEVARRIRQTMHHHPWMADLTMRSNLGPNAVATLEYAMTAVDGLGLDIDGMMDLYATVQQFTMGFVQAELAQFEHQRRTGMDEQTWQRHLGPHVTGLISSGQHPYLKRIVEDAEDVPDQDKVFERRLNKVLDGLTPTPSPPRPPTQRPTD